MQSKHIEETCSSYCFKALKPVLDHAASLQNHINNSKEERQKTDSQPKLETLERQLSILQGRVDTLELLQCKQNIPSQFQKIGSKYYYIDEHDQVNWFTAVHKCHEMGSHLASLQNEAEFKSLKAKLNVNRNYWIDITDLAHEGEYISHTTGLKAPYLNWYPSHNPDNNGGNENCVHLWNHDKTLRMNDERCTSLRNFICEL